MYFYTSDVHLGHANVIKHCSRPFGSVEEMDEALISSWNSRVKSDDTVYIVGDLMYRQSVSPEEYLCRLNGKKHLIIGNHDRSWMGNCDLGRYFESVNNMLYITDGNNQITLCHYPMMAWPHDRKCYMVFGHIHQRTTELAFWPLIEQSELMLNAGADVNGFKPVTFDELVENNAAYKSKVAAAAHTTL